MGIGNGFVYGNRVENIKCIFALMVMFSVIVVSKVFVMLRCKKM